MCEIAVVPGNVEENGINSYVKLAHTLYQQNSHGLGFVAVYDESEYDDDKFNYGYYKTVNPDYMEIKDWLQNNTDAWRIVIHARLATAGGKGLDQAHPIEIIDDDVDAQYVVHNGSVTGHRQKRKQLIKDGHEFNTEVDTEVIAHEHSEIPDALDDDFEGTTLRGNLNWLLFGKDGLLVRNSGKYTLTEDFTMSCRPKSNQGGADDYLPIGEEVEDIGRAFALYKPDQSVETQEIEDRSIYSSTYSTSGYGWGSYSGPATRGAFTGKTRGSSGKDNACSIESKDDSDEDISDELMEERTYRDAYGVKQYQIYDCKLRWVDGAGRLKSGAHNAQSENNELTMSVVESYGDEEYLSCFAINIDGVSVENARVLVRSTDPDYEYEESAIHKTDKYGTLKVPKPDDGYTLKFSLLSIPYEELSEVHKPDYDPFDPLESEADDNAVLTKTEASDVLWWHLYPDRDTTEQVGGYCSLCMKEFSGHECDDCVEELPKSVLLNARDTRNVQEHYGIPAETAKHPGAIEPEPMAEDEWALEDEWPEADGDEKLGEFVDVEVDD